jgi:hypothetical protein
MPDLTPALPPGYRRRAVTALEELVARARVDVARHLATVQRLATAGERTAAARAALTLAEDGLALLKGRRRFMRSDEPPRDAQ